MNVLSRVAIVGRPNVGKSTLFNRISGARRAIVDAEPGSTRDRNVALARWGGREFEVVDTGGMLERPESELEQQVLAQCEAAISESDLICWVVDARAGILPEDQALARRLRPHSGRVLLAVNKIDHPGRLPEALEFHALGFPHLFEISAEHGLGVAELLDELARRLPQSGRGVEEPETRVAIVGRPNVGKSSLLNRLVGKERAVVTERAGTTRDAIDTLLWRDGRLYRIVDTAGIRRRGKIPSRADRLGVLYAEKAIERAHLCFLIVDASQGLTREDAAIAGKIALAGRGAILVLNKWDLVAERESAAERLREEARVRLPHLDYAPLLFVSARSGRGVFRLMPVADRVREQQLRRIPTPDLNRFLSKISARHPPRARDGREVKLYYVTQTGVAPPRFTVFSNLVREVDPGYRRYLARRLREEFGFEGTPVRVGLRRRR